MKLFASVLLLGAAISGFAADHVSLTIYDQNYAVVRDVRSFTLVKGVNDVRFPDISRMILDSPVRVSGNGIIAQDQTFLYHRLSNDFLLQEQLEKKIELMLKDSMKTVIAGTLVGQPRNTSFLIEEADGKVRTVQVADVKDYRYPSLSHEYEIKPALTFKIESVSAGTHDVEAAYEVQGLDWDAHYLLDLSGDDSSAVFSGWATIKNGAGHDFKNARVTLVSGQTARSNRHLRVATDERMLSSMEGLLSRQPGVKLDVSSKETRFTREELSMAGQAMAYQAPQHEQLFGLQTYALPYETDLTDGVEKEMNLFAPAKIKTSTSYEYAHWQNPNQVGVYVHTVNTDSAGLGVPIPSGPVEIYRRRAGNVAEYVGEDRLRNVDKNDPIRFRVGYAEGLGVERKNLKHEGTSKVTDQWEVKIHNDRDTDVNVTLQDFWQDKGKVLSASHKWVETSPRSFEIPVTVPAESDVTVTYEVKTWKSWSKARN